MSYTAMYRRFRPTTFEEVKGQDSLEDVFLELEDDNA